MCLICEFDRNRRYASMRFSPDVFLCVSPRICFDDDDFIDFGTSWMCFYVFLSDVFLCISPSGGRSGNVQMSLRSQCSLHPQNLIRIRTSQKQKLDSSVPTQGPASTVLACVEIPEIPEIPAHSAAWPSSLTQQSNSASRLSSLTAHRPRACVCLSTGPG